MSSTGYIGSDGVYRREEPDLSKLKNDRTTVDKQFDHDSQRRQHRRDLIQPYKNGKLNPEFESAYPAESQVYKEDHIG